MLASGAAFAEEGAPAPVAADPVVIRLGAHEERASEIAWRFGVTLRGVAAQQGQPYSAEFEASLWSLLPYYLDQRVQEVALVAEAKRRGLEPRVEELEGTLERIKSGLAEGQDFESVVAGAGFPSETELRTMIIEADVIQQLMDLIYAEADAGVTDEAVRVGYLAGRDRYAQSEQYCARHILVADEAVAEGLVGELEGGADFAELAAEHGTDGTKTRGGDLGCFGLGAMIPEFEAAVVAAPVGTSVGPVASQFGYHVVLVYDHQPARVQPFDEVKDDVRQYAVAQAANAAMEGILTGAGTLVYPENLPAAP